MSFSTYYRYVKVRYLICIRYSQSLAYWFPLSVQMIVAFPSTSIFDNYQPTTSYFYVYLKKRKENFHLIFPPGHTLDTQLSLRPTRSYRISNHVLLLRHRHIDIAIALIDAVIVIRVSSFIVIVVFIVFIRIVVVVVIRIPIPIPIQS